MTRRVPNRKPAPIIAWMAMVKGLDLTGPIVKTTRLQSAVTPAPRAKLFDWVSTLTSLLIEN